MQHSLCVCEKHRKTNTPATKGQIVLANRITSRGVRTGTNAPRLNQKLLRMHQQTATVAKPCHLGGFLFGNRGCAEGWPSAICRYTPRLTRGLILEHPHGNCCSNVLYAANFVTWQRAGLSQQYLGLLVAFHTSNDKATHSVMGGVTLCNHTICTA